MVVHAMQRLHGERNAPELPLPYSVIKHYANQFGFSDGFCRIVSEYDFAMMATANKDMADKQAHAQAQAKQQRRRA